MVGAVTAWGLTKTKALFFAASSSLPPRILGARRRWDAGEKADADARRTSVLRATIVVAVRLIS
jgi:hypothetical protein